MKKTYGWNVYGLEAYCWDVRMSIAKKKGMDMASRIVDPLMYWVNTGRITLPEAKKLVTIPVGTMAAWLMKYESSVDETLTVIKRKIKLA